MNLPDLTCRGAAGLGEICKRFKRTPGHIGKDYCGRNPALGDRSARGVDREARYGDHGPHRRDRRARQVRRGDDGAAHEGEGEE